MTDVNVFYTNSKLEELTRRHPVSATLGAFYEFLRGDEVFRPGYGAGIFKWSPANNTQAEILIGDLVMNAARQDKWVGIDSGLNSEEAESLCMPEKRKKALSEYETGLSSALDAGLIGLETHGGAVYRVPTDGLAVFVYGRLRNLSNIRERQLGPLTKRLYEILFTAASPVYEGSIAKGVGKILKISPSTVNNEIQEAYVRLGVKDVFTAVYKALESGILRIEEVVGEKFPELSAMLKTLTPREREVLTEMATYASEHDYVTRKDIASRLLARGSTLNVSVATVRIHVVNIQKKVRWSNRAQLAVAAYMVKHNIQ